MPNISHRGGSHLGRAFVRLKAAILELVAAVVSLAVVLFLTCVLQVARPLVWAVLRFGRVLRAHRLVLTATVALLVTIPAMLVLARATSPRMIAVGILMIGPLVLLALKGRRSPRSHRSHLTKPTTFHDFA